MRKGSVFDKPQHLFYPWGNGCGLGLGQKTIKEAVEICLAYAKARHERDLKDHLSGIVMCQNALNAIAKQTKEKS